MRRVAIVLSVAGLLTACTSTSTPAEPSASTVQKGLPTASGSVSATATPQPPDAPRIVWSEVAFEGRVSDAVADRSRFVAVGIGTDGATAWTSQDGRTWLEVDVPERSFGEIGDGVELTGTMGTLVRLGDTLYSFGGMNFMDAVAGAGWRWTDGEAWQVIESQSSFFAGTVTAAAANDEALVAATVSYATGLFGSYTTWRWTPATSWTQTPLMSSEREDIVVEAIAWSQATFVASGSYAAAVEGAERWDWPRALAMWTSPDGLDWRPVQLPTGMSRLCAVASTHGGFAAFGASGDRLAAWTSIDGATWTQGEVDPGEGLAIGDMDLNICSSVVDFGDGLVAFATGADGTLVWTSADGKAWTYRERMPITATAVAALNGRVLVAGWAVGSADPEAGQLMLVGTVEP
jgi:hypothetical protein